jgi:Raf kinase inhibitor-like YbhB/YbcL family protein
MRRVLTVLLVPALVVVAGCSHNDGRTMKPPAGAGTETVGQATTTVAGADTTIHLTTPWAAGSVVDRRYTCDGMNVSPAVSWTGGPADVTAWAVVLTDLSDPSFAHWAVTNIDAGTMSLAEGQVPDTAAVAMNSDAKPDYTGPCPPAGSQHRYSLTVYALSQVLESQNGDPAPQMRAAIEAAAIASVSSEFTYSR